MHAATQNQGESYREDRGVRAGQAAPKAAHLGASGGRRGVRLRGGGIDGRVLRWRATCLHTSPRRCKRRANVLSSVSIVTLRRVSRLRREAGRGSGVRRYSSSNSGRRRGESGAILRRQASARLGGRALLGLALAVGRVGVVAKLAASERRVSGEARQSVLQKSEESGGSAPATPPRHFPRRPRAPASPGTTASGKRRRDQRHEASGQCKQHATPSTRVWGRALVNMRGGKPAASSPSNLKSHATCSRGKEAKKRVSGACRGRRVEQRPLRREGACARGRGRDAPQAERRPRGRSTTAPWTACPPTRSGQRVRRRLRQRRCARAWAEATARGPTAEQAAPTCRLKR
jgi:hypothetical protein